jgi:hypothetical protein
MIAFQFPYLRTVPFQHLYLHGDVIFKRVKWNVTWRMVSSGLLRRVALVRTEVSEEPSASFIMVTRIGELGTTLAVTSNRRTLWFLQEPHGVTSQKTPFFIVTAVKTSNPTKCNLFRNCTLRERSPFVLPLGSFTEIYTAWRFIAEFSRALHSSLSWNRPIQSTPPHSVSRRSILTLHTHPYLGLPSGLFPSCSPTNKSYAFLLSPIHTTCPAHPTFLDLTPSFPPIQN